MLARDDQSPQPAETHAAARAALSRCGGKMVPFAGYEMPVQYPTGVLKEHLHTRSRGRPVRRLAYGPDRAAAEVRQGRGCGAGAGAAGAAGHRSALTPGRQRYALFTNDDGRHPRRPDGREFRRPSVPGGQRRLQGRRRGASARAALPDAARSSRLPIARCSRCRGRRRRRCWRRFAPDVAGDALHGRRAAPRRRHRLLRLALRLHRRGRLRDLGSGRRRPKRWPARCSTMPRCCRSASARATACGSRPGFASTATTSTPRPPGRGRAGLVDPEEPPQRRRARRRLSRRRRDPARSSPTARRAAASA